MRTLQEQLRTAWERAVENAVGPVLRRLSNKVSTPGPGKLTATTLKDCDNMPDAFGRCSGLPHSEVRDLNTRLPAREAIQAEISALKTWVESIAERQKAFKPVEESGLISAPAPLAAPSAQTPQSPACSFRETLPA